MADPAPSIDIAASERRSYDYEQPLSERMRTFMRLEFLYQQTLFHAEQDSDWSTRSATSCLLDMLTILTRGDVRADVLKELDHQLRNLERFQSLPDVDSARLGALIGNLTGSRKELQSIGTQYLQPLRENEFLSAIKHRSAIPGGTCEFDLPEFSHWLRQSFSRRQQDLSRWISIVRPVCDAVVELLWLIREIAQPEERLAIAGMYQHTVPKETQCQVLRVLLPAGSPLFPEISGSHHRFTVRFLEWSTVEERAVQTSHDVNFRISIC